MWDIRNYSLLFLSEMSISKKNMIPDYKVEKIGISILYTYKTELMV